jgi:hypothetical protein
MAASCTQAEQLQMQEGIITWSGNSLLVQCRSGHGLLQDDSSCSAFFTSREKWMLVGGAVLCCAVQL